jgi:hypothetical protein
VPGAALMAIVPEFAVVPSAWDNASTTTVPDMGGVDGAV